MGARARGGRSFRAIHGEGSYGYEFRNHLGGVNDKAWRMKPCRKRGGGGGGELSENVHFSENV